jgi:hypothetical protein
LRFLEILPPPHKRNKTYLPSSTSEFDFGKQPERIKNIVLITSFNGFFIAATRVLFATGRGGLLPRWLGDINEKYCTPKTVQPGYFT